MKMLSRIRPTCVRGVQVKTAEPACEQEGEKVENTEAGGSAAGGRAACSAV